MRIVFTQEVELSEEQENWPMEDLIDYARDLINNGAINSDTVNIEIEVE